MAHDWLDGEETEEVDVVVKALRPRAVLLQTLDGEEGWVPLSILSSTDHATLEQAELGTVVTIEIPTWKLEELGWL